MILVITTVASVIQTGNATVKVMLGVVIFTIVVVMMTGDAPPVILIRDAPVTRLDVIVIEMKGAELMVSVQLTTTCLVVSVRDIISATATEMMDVGPICTALSAIMMLSVMIFAATVIVTGDATVKVMLGVVILTIVVVMMTGTAPLATVSVTGS